MIHAIMAKPRKEPGKLILSYLSVPSAPVFPRISRKSLPTRLSSDLYGWAANHDVVSHPLAPSDIDRVDNPGFCSRSALFSFLF